MGDTVHPQPLTHDRIVSELSAMLADPVHKRIVKAWTPDDPVQAMELELARILKEAVADED